MQSNNRFVHVYPVNDGHDVSGLACWCLPSFTPHTFSDGTGVGFVITHRKDIEWAREP